MGDKTLLLQRQAELAQSPHFRRLTFVNLVMYVQGRIQPARLGVISVIFGSHVS